MSVPELVNSSLQVTEVSVPNSLNSPLQVNLQNPCDDSLFLHLMLRIPSFSNAAPFFRFTRPEIEVFRRDYKNEKLRLLHMLWQWKRKYGSDATYITLHRVFLRMNDKRLAEFVVEYTKSCPAMDSVDSHVKPWLSVKYENWDRMSEGEKEQVKNDLVHQNQEVREKYALVVVDIFDSFVERNVRIGELKLFLFSLGIPVNKRPDESSIVPLPYIDNDATLQDVFLIVLCCYYSSWFNIQLLKVVVERFGCDDDNLMLTTYEENVLVPYLDRSIFEIPSNSFAPGHKFANLPSIALTIKQNIIQTVQDVLSYSHIVSELLEMEEGDVQFIDFKDDIHMFLTFGVLQGCFEFKKWMATFYDPEKKVYTITDGYLYEEPPPRRPEKGSTLHKKLSALKETRKAKGLDSQEKQEWSNKLNSEDIKKTFHRKDTEFKKVKDETNAIELELQHLEEKSSLLSTANETSKNIIHSMEFELQSSNSSMKSKELELQHLEKKSVLLTTGNNDSKQASESKDSELEILRIETEPSTEELGKKRLLLKAEYEDIKKTSDSKASELEAFKTEMRSRTYELENVRKMSDIKYSELETLKTEMKSKEEKLQKDERMLSESSLFYPIENELREREAQLEVALQTIKELNDENEMKRKIGQIKDIELEKLEATVKIYQEKLQNLTEKLSLLTEDVEKNDDICELSYSKDSPTLSLKDAAVQFDYRVPVEDQLDSVHVAGETVFYIHGQKDQCYCWEECGFRMTVPQGTFPQSDVCEVVVKALVAGDFHFPKGCNLITAVYIIMFAKTLLKPVEVELQHCVSLTEKEEAKYLSFVIAGKDDLANNDFDFLDGGKFSPGTQYCSIKQLHFCKLGAVMQPETQDDEAGSKSSVVKYCYTGQIYYEHKGLNKWLVLFMIVKELNVLIKYVASEYPTAEKDAHVKFCFADPLGFIELDLHAIQRESCKGWKINPHTTPCRLLKSDADEFGGEKSPVPPSCLLTVFAKLEQDTEYALHYSVPLIGVQSQNKEIHINRFLEGNEEQTSKEKSQLVFDHYKQAQGIQESKLQGMDLPDVITATNQVVDWFTLGLYLRLAFDELETIERDHPGDIKHCRQKMLNSWISLGNATWSVLRNVLRKMNEGAVADKIEEMYLTK